MMPAGGFWRVVGLVVLMSACISPRAFAGGLTLACEGDRFTVNGQARYLVLISYFDALRAPDDAIGADFAWLQSLGVDGLRVFPNWWNWRDMEHFPADTLLDGDGNLRAAQLAKLKSVLEKAAAHGLIVDVSFAFETVGGLSDLREEQLGVSQGVLPVNQVHIDAYERGLVSAATELRGFRHVFFDIQNEYNGRITHLSDKEVSRLRSALKDVDPDRIVTASLANEIGPEEVAKRSDGVGVDVVGWHESRNPWRFDDMDRLVREAKDVTGKPVYLGEPASMDDELTAENFITAVCKAKAGGAAAWTFHTQGGFDLRNGRLADKLSEREKAFLRSFKTRLDATS